METKIVGKSMTRKDAVAKVTGEAKFVADFTHPRTLWCKIVRSSEAHAKILAIDTRRAEQLPGVKGVITGTQAHFLMGDCLRDQPVLATDKVRFVGQPVAAVVAEDEDTAAYAAELVKIEYKPLPAVFLPLAGAQANAPLLHDELASYFHLPGFCPQPGTNIFHRHKIAKGNLEQGLAAADVILENQFSYQHAVHCQIEPHGAIAVWDREGGVTMWSSSQSPHFVRGELAEMFHLPINKVRVIASYLGGCFGGKSDFTIEPLTAAVAKFFPGNHVRLILEREEVFKGTLIGRGMEATIKTGVKKDGTLVACEIKIYLNGGAYGNCAVNVVTGITQAASGPYEIPNLSIACHGVYTNCPPIGAFRGYGHPEAHWAIERHMDMLAAQLHMSPLDIRLKNALAAGKVNAIGQTISEHNGRVDICMRKVAEALESSTPTPSATGRTVLGKGLSAFMKFPVMPPNAGSSAILRINPDGTVNINISATEMGQGCYTSLAQIAAEALGIDNLDRIKIAPLVDTDFTPYEWQTVASKTTWTVGNAIISAAKKAIDQMKETAAQVWRVSAQEIQYNEGKFSTPGVAGKTLSWKELAMGYQYPQGNTIGGPIVTTGYYVPAGLHYANPEHGQGNSAAEWTFGSTGVWLEIECATGAIYLRKLICAIDVGKVINPQLAKAQMTGSLIQSASVALAEEIKYRQGNILNDNFTDYKIFSWNDVKDTEFEVIFVETPQPGGPFGARPLAEHGMIGTAPAIAAAIANATATQIFDLPITRERLLARLQATDSKKMEAK